MSNSDLSNHFQGLWLRALNEPSLERLTPELLSGWATERGLLVTQAKELDVGAFGKAKSIVLTISGVKACFPKIPATGDPTWQSRNQHAEEDAALWEKVEWFCPLWIPMAVGNKILADARHVTKERAIEMFNYHMSTNYTVAFQATCIAQIMPQSRSLQDFCSLARESFLAFFSGYRASSIAALIPAIEGAITRIVSGSGSEVPISVKIDRAIDQSIATAARMHYDSMWVPREYLETEYLLGQDERVFVFETFRRWLQKSFFRNTGEYDGATWLNRHIFAHGAATSWQQSANFSRLIVALATLGVIESWHDETHKVSLFFPAMNEDSTLLWQQALFQAEAQMTLKLIEQQRYQQSGRLVPEMPTDDGVMLRKAKLSEDCIQDLVRPLRAAGWSVEVGEPDDRALYMKVVASADGERFSAALLFGCNTDNHIYRQLDETCSAILYRGAPYNQDQCAYGIQAHVGPVTGWQPPQAPSNRTDR